MPGTLLYCRDTASDLTGGADFSNKLLSASSTSVLLAISVAAGATEEQHWWSEPGVPSNAAWETGDWIILVRSRVGNANIRGSIRIDRVNSAGVVQQSTTATAEQIFSASNTTYTFSGSVLNAVSWSPGAPGDRIRVTLLLRNTAGTAQSWTIAFNVSGTCDVTSPVTTYGLIEATISGATGMAASIAGYGDVQGTISAAADMAAVLAGYGDVQASMNAASGMAAALDGAGGLLAAIEAATAMGAILDGHGAVVASFDAATDMAVALDGRGGIVASIDGQTGFASTLDGWGNIEAELAVVTGMACSMGAPDYSDISARIECVTSMACFMDESYKPLAGFTNVSYASSQCPVHPIHSYSAWAPHGVPPPGGWPFVAVASVGGFTGTTLNSTITRLQLQYYMLLRAGFGLIIFTVPVSRGGATGNAVSSPTYDPGNGLFGDPYGGNGTVWPRDVPMPTGFAVHPWEDPTWFSPLKAAGMFTQHISTQLATLNFSSTMKVIAGRSAGGYTAGSVYYSEDMSSMWTTFVDPQDSVNTQGFWDAGMFDVAPFWWPVYDLDGIGPAPDLVPAEFKAYALPRTVSGLWDVPATTMGFCTLTHRARASILWMATRPAVVAANATRPVYLTYGAAGTAGAPYDMTNTSGTELKIHINWDGKAMKSLFPAATRFVCSDAAAYESAFFDAIIDDPESVYSDQIQWLRGLFDYHWPMTGSIRATTGMACRLENAVGEYEALHLAVNSKFRVDIGQGFDVPIQFDNKAFAEPDDGLFIKLHVAVEQTSQIEFGARNTHRKFGTARATICVPLAGGVQPAEELADRIFGAFANVTDGIVRYGAPRTDPPNERRARAEDGTIGAGAWWELAVEVPFISDFTPDVRPVPIVGVAPTFESVGNALRTRFRDLVETEHGVPVHYGNSKPQAIASPLWARFTIVQGASTRVSGSGVSALYRTAGVAIAQIFVPAERGDQPALALADRINTAFRAVAIAGADFRTPLVRNVGRDGPHWQLNVSLPFTVDRAVPVTA